jgi:ribosomal protein S27AE
MMDDDVIMMATFCPECGAGVKVDEDGNCSLCGACAMGPELNKLLNKLDVSEAQRVSAERAAGDAVAGLAAAEARGFNAGVEAARDAVARIAADVRLDDRLRDAACRVQPIISALRKPIETQEKPCPKSSRV